MTASDNRFEKYFPHILKSFRWSEITFSCYNVHDSFVFYTDLSPVGILAFSSLGAKSALCLLKLGRLLHNLGSVDVFLASALLILFSQQRVNTFLF